MPCAVCGRENPATAKFCNACGARLELSCQQCGHANPPGSRFCNECGAPLTTSSVSSSHQEASPPARFASLQTYTPAHLAEKILTSRDALEGERKQVTVLFADLKGSTELLADRDPEEARRILDPVLERMMEAVHRFEGTVNQVMGDGIMALFGAPIAHEDHTVRACYAAMRMQDAVKRYAEEVRRTQGIPIQIRVGLNSGGVLVRSIGSDLHMDYTAVGQTTHLAARMEQMAAPGTILVAPDTLALVEGYVQVKALGPMPVRGLAEPVEVYEVVGAGLARTRMQAAAARGLTRFVGRDMEIETLRSALDRAGRHQGQAVAVVGEAGVGKSRLAYELAHSHRTNGWLVLEGSSASYGKATPYLPVSDLLRGYFGIEPREDDRRVREKVAGKVLMLDEALRSDLPAFLTLIDAQVENPAWQALEPEDRKQRTRDGVRRLLLRESQVQPLLLVFEDLHWIDAETQAVLDSLVDSLPGARMLLLVNYRPEYWHGWGSKTYYTQVRLDPLGAESADELCRDLMGNDASLDPLKRLLIAQTEGNPFFLEESIRTLAESGALAGERGAYRLARPVESTQAPATVQAVLAARVDRLSAEDKRLLQAAAVVGTDIAYPVLRAIADEPEGRLQQGLARLQAAEFLYEASLFPEPEYTFKHALTHQVAYDSVLQERRRALHERIMEAIEGLYVGRLADHLEALAQHAVRGEVWPKAVDYLEQASAKAAARVAYGEAVRLLEQALEIQRLIDPDDGAKQCDLLLALGAALGPAGDPQRAYEDAAPQALALAEQQSDGQRAFLACRLALESAERYGEGTGQYTPSYPRWLERADRYAVGGTIAQLYADIAQAGDVRSLRHAEELERILQGARQANDPDLLMRAVTPMIGPGRGPRYEAAKLEIAREFLARSRHGVAAPTLEHFFRVTQMVFVKAGERAEAEQVWRETQQLAARTQDPWVTFAPMLFESVRALLDGDLEEALAAAERVLAKGTAEGSLAAGQQFRRNLTFRPLLYLGRAEQAAAQDPEPARFVWLEVAARFNTAISGLYAAHLGRVEEAQAQLRRNLADVSAAADEGEVPSGALAVMLETAILVADRGAVEFLAPLLEGLAAAPASNLSVSNVARHLGEASVLLGDRAAALAHYERALEWATRVGHRPEVALTRLGVAELLLDEAPSGQQPATTGGADGNLTADRLKGEGLEHLDFATEQLRAMKMQPALERALQCKRPLPT